MNVAQKSRVSKTFLRFTLNIHTFFLIHSSRFLVQLVLMAADVETHSSSSSSSTSFSARYDVFLSFRGEDTRTSFTDHLYAALRGAGIRTFRDNEELRHGEEIGPELLKAIKGSRISIPVFSENYAFSKWCLKELAQIMERKKTDGQIVLPIFYKVDPSNVRNPTERFEEAFREQPEETVDSWKKALREAGNLKGWDTRYSYESELINSVVKKVWSELNKTAFDVAKHPVEIDSRVEEVLRLLYVESKDVRFMVIHGMGGIGKTTIAKAVYNKIFCDFHNKSFLADVRDTASLKGLVQLQNNLLGDILPGIDADIRSEGEGIKMIKQNCHEMKVLIILDDVDNRKNLNALAGGWDWFGPGSKIIITSRNMDILNVNHGDKYIIYLAKELNDRQSLQLFSKHAFGTNEPQQNFQDLSSKFVRKAGGLPLALEVLGSSLYDYKTPTMWESILERLNKVPDTDIQEKLKFSYDGLNEFDQAIFLDIACFLIGMDKETIIQILGGESTIGIEILVRRSLVKIDDKNKLRMHDLLQEMGREIVRKEDPKNPEMRSRLWDHNEALNILREGKGTRNIEGLLLDFGDYSKDHCLEIEAFEAMPKLRLLKIYHADHVVGKFGHLPRGLKWLSWEGSPCRSITIPHLEKLAVLDISGSMKLSRIKGISGLPLLKELDLQECTRLQSLPKLPRSLIRLNVSGCTSMIRLPNLSNLKNLKDLCLVMCNKLAEIQGLESLESLINLDVTGCQTYFKTLGMIVAQGTIPDGVFDEGKMEKHYEVPNGDNIKGTVFYFVYELPVGIDDRDFYVEAEIQRNDGKKIRCCCNLTSVSLSWSNEDRVCSCYFPGLTWLGFPLKNGDKIKLNAVEIRSFSRVFRALFRIRGFVRKERKSELFSPTRTSLSLKMLDFVMEYEAIGDSQQLGKRVSHLITSYVEGRIERG